MNSSERTEKARKVAGETGKPYKGHILSWYTVGTVVCGLYEDGRFIRTSAVQTLEPDAYVETRNSVYSLGSHAAGLTPE